MEASQKSLILKWIDNWKAIDQVQQELRVERLRKTVTSDSIAAFDSAFESARKAIPLRTTSGLVEFHRLLAKSV